ncbi:Gfo/Idh/MocA family oxidoreductase [Rhodobacterales bacterium HKCCE3408]|nr:Gfo/Idh/MocA family oxidoreductase [Rhodobacterales bacterium HKCCE3408]
MADRDDYALVSSDVSEVPAPEIDYRPPKPSKPHRIALVGAGGISFAHLDAYKTHGIDVAAILSRDIEKAKARAAEFFPEADVPTDYAALLARDDIDVIDLTPHPEQRVALIEAALKAGKHVLSQKPFVTDLETGRRLCDLADAQGVKLAVNQNGRWAPHMAWMREAVRLGLIGEVIGLHCSVHWDHTWIRGTVFEEVPDLVLYDFGIHWFDFVTSIMGRLADGVMAQAVQIPSAEVAPPMGASALMDFGQCQASLIFDGATRYGPLDRTYVAGTKGSLISTGPDLGNQRVELFTEHGVARPVLEGNWFNDGFAGAMGALLVAIEAGEEPENGARANLTSLANCFAALESARTGLPVGRGNALFAGGR